jgi:predicted TIM-barrel fold metal-dependent hydrolase
VPPIIDIHTHCAARTRDDPFGVVETLRAIPVGKNAVTNYRGLPAVSYREMSDFDLQQEVCAKAGITGRIISNPFAAEVIAAISSKPAIDVVKHVNDQNAAIVARAPATNWGLGTLNPLDASHIAEGERCLGPLGFKGLLITTPRPPFRFGNGHRTGKHRSSSIRRGYRSGTTSRWTSTSSTKSWGARSTPPWRSPA